MLLNTLFFVVGMALLIKGADWLVDGSSALARRLGVSDLAIGLTIVAFGTSMPELVVNLVSAFNNSTDLAIGNIVGSNIVNILFILGVSSLIRPLRVQTSTVWKEIPLALLSALAMLAAANDLLLDGTPSVIGRSDGLLFIGFFIIFLWYIWGMAGREDESTDQPTAERVLGAWASAGLVLLGLLFLIGGGKLVVESAVAIATSLGVSEALIGLTIVGVGTSLPELFTSVAAARKGNADIAVGNVVGSNIFNVFWILGITSIIRPLPFGQELQMDLLVNIAASLLLFLCVHAGWAHRRVFLFWRQRQDHQLNRIEGGLMILLYALYIGYLVWRG